MAKKKNIKPNILTKEQEQQLENMVNKMIRIAADTVEEYEDADPSELLALSGSITQIHEDSPFLNDLFKGDNWKRIMTNVQNKPKKPDVD